MVSPIHDCRRGNRLPEIRSRCRRTTNGTLHPNSVIGDGIAAMPAAPRDMIGCAGQSPMPGSADETVRMKRKDLSVTIALCVSLVVHGVVMIALTQKEIADLAA